MNKYCIGLLIIVVVYLCFKCNMTEGLDGSATTTSGASTTSSLDDQLSVKHKLDDQLSVKHKLDDKLSVTHKLDDQLLVAHKINQMMISVEAENKRKATEAAIKKKKAQYAIHHHHASGDSEIARRNFKMCEDTGEYHSCNVDYRKPPPIYINPPPPTKLNPSNVYNKLSICPQAYEENMNRLRMKKSLGQYSGYSENEYIDRTRYIHPKKGKEPLPINPDFFMKDGGTFA